MLVRATVVISLAVGFLALAAWMMSHIRPTAATLLRAKPDRAVFVTSRQGVLSFWTQEITPLAPAGCDVRLTTPYRITVAVVEPGRGANSFMSSFNPDWPRFDLGWDTIRNTTGTVYVGGTPYNFTFRVRRMGAAWWMIVTVTLIAPALRLTWWLIRRRRVVAGRCPVCGYDLRATPDRCPECGTPAYNPPA
jgi:hypothetical protein